MSANSAAIPINSHPAVGAAGEHQPLEAPDALPGATQARLIGTQGYIHSMGRAWAAHAAGSRRIHGPSSAAAASTPAAPRNPQRG